MVAYKISSSKCIIQIVVCHLVKLDTVHEGVVYNLPCSLQATKLLLPYCEKRNIEDCLLFAISLSSENLAMAMLKHPRYIDIDAQNRKMEDSGSFDVLPSNSKFPTNTTPLVLAAEQNLYEVVRHLLVEGHTISKPHPLSCPCVTCAKKSKADYFRFAHERLNAYRGLASESYLSLSSDDPILDAFMLRKTLLKLAETEEHFKVSFFFGYFLHRFMFILYVAFLFFSSILLKYITKLSSTSLSTSALGLFPYRAR